MTLSPAFSSNKLSNKLLVTINDLIEYFLLDPLLKHAIATGLILPK